MVTFTEAILEPRLQDCFGKCDILLYCLIKVLKTAVFSDLRRYSKHRSNLFILIFFMLQHIMESIEEKNKVKKLKKADITQEALMKLIQITIHKNATYLSDSTVAEFVRVINDWMHKETMPEFRNYDHFTLLLDETTDTSTWSESSLIVRIIKNGVVFNHFLDLLQLPPGDETIFRQ